MFWRASYVTLSLYNWYVLCRPCLTKKTVRSLSKHGCTLYILFTSPADRVFSETLSFMSPALSSHQRMIGLQINIPLRSFYGLKYPGAFAAWMANWTSPAMHQAFLKMGIGIGRYKWEPPPVVIAATLYVFVVKEKKTLRGSTKLKKKILI